MVVQSPHDSALRTVSYCSESFVLTEHDVLVANVSIFGKQKCRMWQGLMDTECVQWTGIAQSA